MPKLDGILETALYTGDMARARAFYEGTLGLQPIFEDKRLVAYGVAGRDVLLIFPQGAATETVTFPGGTIPGHDGSGPQHIAFRVGKEEMAVWETHLATCGVAIEGETKWSRGGRSIYFRDPDGHLLELATPGLWAVY
ncbi:MAG: glyoxalase [Alphaproteobacteria bacterium]|nr:glyoxalase [Alphaproteobacteria bacterium]